MKRANRKAEALRAYIAALEGVAAKAVAVTPKGFDDQAYRTMMAAQMKAAGLCGKYAPELEKYSVQAAEILKRYPSLRGGK